MTVYRVEFSRDWITGRWGFTDRTMTNLNGRVTEPSRLENAWIVNFQGTASDLGDLLSERLNIGPEHLKRFGTIFEITILTAPHGPEPRRSRRRATDPPAPPWERSRR